MAVIFSALSKSFLSTGNLVSLLENYSVMAIMAAGLLVVLISGGIDISFAAIAAVSQYVMATVLVRIGGNWIVAFGLAAGFGTLLGVVNALLIYYGQCTAPRSKLLEIFLVLCSSAHQCLVLAFDNHCRIRVTDVQRIHQRHCGAKKPGLRDARRPQPDP